MNFGRTPDESAELGRQIYAGMQAEMEANHWGQLVVIDVNSGDYEVGDYDGDRSDLALTKRLRQRHPDAHTWTWQVGNANFSVAQLSWRQTMWVLANRQGRQHDRGVVKPAPPAYNGLETRNQGGPTMHFGRTPDESAELGRQIYAGMQAEMEANHWGQLVVIDVNSGDYEVGDYDGERSDIALTKRLCQRRPGADTWAELVGGELKGVQLSWRQTMWILANRKERQHD